MVLVLLASMVLVCTVYFVTTAASRTTEMLQQISNNKLNMQSKGFAGSHSRSFSASQLKHSYKINMVSRLRFKLQHYYCVKPGENVFYRLAG